MMPSFRKKVAGFIRQLSNPGSSLAECEPEEVKSPTTGSFIHRYLCGEPLRCQPEIQCGRSFQDLPVQHIAALSPTVKAAYTGPSGGLTRVRRRVRHVDVRNPNLAFIDDEPSSWRTPKLAQQEDLDEFLLDETNKNTQRSKSNGKNRSKGRQRAPPASADLQKKKSPSNVGAGDSGCSCEEEENEGDGSTRKTDKGFIKGCADDFKDSERMDVAGIEDWNRPHEWAFGAATTLYERHPLTQRNAGDPIADAFAISVRENSALLVMADGVNWGEKSCLAARCAVHGCVDYINNAVFETHAPVQTTKDVFLVLLRSLFAAHNLILEEDGMLTTLCVAFVCPLEDSDKFAVCACNVGDSLAYVYSSTHGVREITQGSHDIYSMRDMRDALGALGPVDGLNPELNNLTCSMTLVEAGDIVFLTSDGISDNFDPVVGKFAIPRERERNNNHNHQHNTNGSSSSTSSSSSSSSSSAQNGHRDRDLEKPSQTAHNNPRANNRCAQQQPATDHAGLPVVEAHQRHALTLLRMEDLLVNGVTLGDRRCESARDLCQALIDFATKLTVAKRRILEDPDLYSAGDENLSSSEQKERRKKLGDKLAMVPGKLDHASVVAYRVGVWIKDPLDVEEEEEEEEEVGVEVENVEEVRVEVVEEEEEKVAEEEAKGNEGCAADDGDRQEIDSTVTSEGYQGVGGLVGNKENMSPNPNPNGRVVSPLSIVRRSAKANALIGTAMIESVV